jgi:hypothetical protein
VAGKAKVCSVLDPQKVTTFEQQTMTGNAVNLAVDELYPALFRNRNRLEFVSSTGWRILLIVRMGFAKKTDWHAAGRRFSNYIVMT